MGQSKQAVTGVATRTSTAFRSATCAVPARQVRSNQVRVPRRCTINRLSMNPWHEACIAGNLLGAVLAEVRSELRLRGRHLHVEAIADVPRMVVLPHLAVLHGGRRARL